MMLEQQPSRLIGIPTEFASRNSARSLNNPWIRHNEFDSLTLKHCGVTPPITIKNGASL
jgi:hypothetical protein